MVTPAELLNFANVKQDIQKFLFNNIFFAVFIDNLNHQAQPPLSYPQLIINAQIEFHFSGKTV